MFDLTLEEILNIGLEEDEGGNAPPEPRRKRPAGENGRLAALEGWLARRGGLAAVRDVVACRVAGVRNAAEARRLLRALAAQGRGRFVIERSGKTRQRKEIFMLLPEEG